MSDRKSGYIYILSNESMSGALKIGMTTRTPELRAKELSAVTSIPTPFTVVFSAVVPDCKRAEIDLHRLLEAKNYRVSDNREFFQIPLAEAILIASQVCQDHLSSGEEIDFNVSRQRPEEIYNEAMSQFLLESGLLGWCGDTISNWFENISPLGECLALLQRAENLGSRQAKGWLEYERARQLKNMLIESDLTDALQRYYKACKRAIGFGFEGGYRAMASGYIAFSLEDLTNFESSMTESSQDHTKALRLLTDGIQVGCYNLIADKIDLLLDLYERGDVYGFIEHDIIRLREIKSLLELYVGFVSERNCLFYESFCNFILCLFKYESAGTLRKDLLIELLPIKCFMENRDKILNHFEYVSEKDIERTGSAYHVGYQNSLLKFIELLENDSFNDACLWRNKIKTWWV